VKDERSDEGRLDMTHCLIANFEYGKCNEDARMKLVPKLKIWKSGPVKPKRVQPLSIIFAIKPSQCLDHSPRPGGRSSLRGGVKKTMATPCFDWR
jgi:hypothetical protein